MADSSDAPVRWLLLHELHDTSVPWLLAHWRRRLGRQARSLQAMSSAQLTLQLRQRWWLDGDGARGRLLLAGPRPCTVELGLLHGVLSRVSGPWLPPGTVDADYQQQERQALLLAWLAGLGSRVINRPQPDSLPGAAPAASRARLLAAQAGWPVWPWRGSSRGASLSPTPPPMALTTTLLVAAGRVHEAGPGALLAPQALGHFRERACALAQTFGLDVAGLQFAFEPQQQRWLFTGVTPLPDLRAGGPALADALADRLGLPAMTLAEAA